MLTKKDLDGLSSNELRVLLKKKKNDSAKFKVMQLGLKVTSNSAYGMIGNAYSRFYDILIAEGITLSGQLSIQWIKRALNEFLNKSLGMTGHDFSIAGDTDSVYLSLSPLVDKVLETSPDLSKNQIVTLLDNFCEKHIQPVINASYDELADYMNAPKQKMIMKREVIADVGVWRAKKNYALNVYNSEGVQYDEPKLKIMGMESVRSSTPEICRDAFKDALKLIMTKTEKDVQVFIKQFESKFMDTPIEDISFPRGVSDLDKWLVGVDINAHGQFMKGTPIHVKASITYNRLRDMHKLHREYREIKNGDKIKFIYIKPDNPTGNNAIAYPDILPPEFGFNEFINLNLQYKKTFLYPIESVLDVIGWSSKPMATLTKFFV